MYLAIIALLFHTFAFQPSFAFDPKNAIVSEAGTLPLILTVPHDGGDPLGSLSPRSKGPIVRDVGTRQLAEQVAKIIEAKTGKKPYLVIATISSRFLDLNRAEAEAMESPEALPAYAMYHNRVAGFVREVSSRFPGGGLLVDVHGQSDEPGTIFRGTRGGLTVKSLIARHGVAAVQGEQSVTGLLEAKGYHVTPSRASQSLQEDRRFNGGYTVSTYGSQHPGGIDAIQLEFGRTYRSKSTLADDFADALIVFMRRYNPWSN